MSDFRDVAIVQGALLDELHLIDASPLNIGRNLNACPAAEDVKTLDRIEEQRWLLRDGGLSKAILAWRLLYLM